jgi:hypothetical protein
VAIAYQILKLRQPGTHGVHFDRVSQAFSLGYPSLAALVGPILTSNVPVVYMAPVPNDFDVGKIQYKGHWNGWALKIETFLGPGMATGLGFETKHG